jgi:hypothetical protein
MPKTIIVAGAGVSEVQRCVHLKDGERGFTYKAPYAVEMELCQDCVTKFDQRLGIKTTVRKPDDIPGEIDWQPLRLRDRT